jgi:hypothetical protein
MLKIKSKNILDNSKVEIFSILEQGEKQNLFERQPS